MNGAGLPILFDGLNEKGLAAGSGGTPRLRCACSDLNVRRG
jgi:hypothetical protein